jgi:N-acetylglucosamine-6-phosphate deacetylase
VLVPDAVQVVRGRVVLDDAVIEDGTVVVEGATIRRVGPSAGTPPPGGAPLRRAAWVVPGLVDVHSHGGAGAGFPDADAAGCLAAVAHHRAHGTTTMLASLVSAPFGVLEERVRLLAGLVEAGELAGIHLEGPFLSDHRRGAHDPGALTTGDRRAVERLLTAGRGAVRSMTLAPEVPGYADVVATLRDRGVLPSLGHTDASAAEFGRGVALAGAGPLSVTHLFNGMSPFDHRRPGAVTAALAAAARGQAVVELIADGVHLHPDTVAAVFALLGPERIVLVSDSMAAAGMSDGRYRLGALDVDVVDGVARLASADGAGSIAGGTARLVDVLRHTVTVAGVAITDAVRSAAGVPAALLGLDRVGRIAPGLSADLLLLDDDLRPTAVLHRGKWIRTGSDENDETTEGC